MKKTVKNIRKDTFVKNSFIFFIGSFVVATINYLYYPVMGRILSVEDFGEVQVIATIVLQITIVLSVLGYITINIFTNSKDKNICRQRIRELEGTALTIITIFSLIALLFSGYINSYLKFSSSLVLLSLAIIFVANVPYTVKNGWLQANNKFKEISIGAFIAATGKLVFALPLIFLGFKISGALLGLVFATFPAIIYVNLRAKTKIKLFDHLKKNYFKLILRDEKLKKDLLYGLFIFFALFSINLLYSADVIIIRLYFSTTDSGLYSGVASIGRIIFFSTFAISAVLLPSIKISGRTKDNMKNLKKALGITLLLGGFILFLFFVTPQMIINIMLGANYLTYSSLLFKVGFFILLASVLNVLLVYGIALRKILVSIIAFVAVILVFVLSFFNNNSIDSIVNNFIIINALSLVATAAYLVFIHKKPPVFVNLGPSPEKSP